MLDYCHLHLSEKIGEGGTAVVYRGEYHAQGQGSQRRSTKVDVAVKVINLQDFDRHLLVQTLREVNILSQIRHPNIIWLVGLALAPPQILVVMEYADQGSLFDINYMNTEKRKQRVRAQPRERRVPEGTSAETEHSNCPDGGGGGSAFSAAQRSHFVLDCVRGLHRLHSNAPAPVLHCDLKSL